MRVLPLFLILGVAACRDERPPAPTSEQSQQLNEAEAMLNEMDNEEGPENRSPGPSNQSD